MNEQLGSLHEEDFLKIYNAPVYLAILIALEDGKISNKEVRWAEKLTEIKSKLEVGKLKEYYEVALVNFDEKFNTVQRNLAEDKDQARQQLREKLREVNAVINNHDDKNFAVQLRESLLSYAKRVKSTTENLNEIMALFANPMLGADDPEVSP